VLIPYLIIRIVNCSLHFKNKNMKDIELIDKTLDRIAQMGDMEIEIETRDLERICRLALEQVKNCSIHAVTGRSEELLVFAKWLDEETIDGLLAEPDYYVKRYLNQ